MTLTEWVVIGIVIVNVLRPHQRSLDHKGGRLPLPLPFNPG